MNLRIAILVLGLTAVNSAPAQLPDSLWSRVYGGEWHQVAKRVVATPDGGLAIAGNHEYGGQFSDFLLMRVNANGDSLWARTYGGNGVDVLESLIAETDGGFAAAGYTIGVGDSSEILVVRSNSSGDPLWQRSYGYSFYARGYDMLRAIHGGYYVAGTVYVPTATGLFVSHLSDDGVPIHAFASSGSYQTEVFSALNITSNRILVAGADSGSGLQSDEYYVGIYDSLGDVFLHRHYGGTSRDRCHRVIRTRDGGYLLGGTTLSFGAGDQDIWILKVDELGDSLWSRMFGGSFFDDFGGVIERANGGFLVVGTHEDENDGNFNLLFGACDASGGSFQQRFIGGSANDEGADIVAISDHEFVVAGTTRSWGAPGRNFWLMKFADLPHIGTDRANINFGGAHVGDSTMRSLSVINTGAVELIVHGLALPADFRATASWPQTLTPGDSLPLEIYFIPSRVGAYIDTLFVLSDAATGPHPARVLGSGIAVSVDELPVLPAEIAFHPAYPNPFNVTTTINFELTWGMSAIVDITNLSGQVVATLYRGDQAGWHRLSWNAGGHSSGPYFARLTTPATTHTQKLLLVR